jgi:hypothetical protein
VPYSLALEISPLGMRSKVCHPTTDIPAMLIEIILYSLRPAAGKRMMFFQGGVMRIFPRMTRAGSLLTFLFWTAIPGMVAGIRIFREKTATYRFFTDFSAAISVTE